MKTQKITTDQLREAHVRMEGQAETGRKIKDKMIQAVRRYGRDDFEHLIPISQEAFIARFVGWDRADLITIWKTFQLGESVPIMDAEDEISRLKARIAELETDNLNLIDQLRGQK